jgi:stage II sporulation protein D
MFARAPSHSGRDPKARSVLKASWVLIGSLLIMAFMAAIPVRADTWTLDRVRFEPVLPEGPQPPGNPANWLTADGIGSYRGALVVTRDGANVAVLNDVPLDHYLLGLSEMPRTWPLAALQAQVVAARTYALWHVLARPPSPWAATGAQICASDACQVYRGLIAEQAKGSGQWAAAVATTAGQILMWHRLVLFPAYGSSDGGQTLSGGVPWLPSVADPEDTVSPLHRWQWNAPLAVLEAPLGVVAPDHLADIKSQPNQIVITVTHADGSSTSSALDVNTFYSTLNRSLPPPAGLPRPLPSRRFSVWASSGQVNFAGGGYGNLVGLSQYGALGKALKGMVAPDILAAYYGGVRPTVLAPAQLPATIRVEVATGSPKVRLWAPGPVRVVDGSGKQLVVASGGTWTVSADPGGKLRVEPAGAVAQPTKLAGPPPPAGDAPIPTAPNPPVSPPSTLPPLKPAAIGAFPPSIRPLSHTDAGRTVAQIAAVVLLVATATAVTAAGWRRRREGPFAMAVTNDRDG